MKTLLSLGWLVVLGALPVQAQIFRPEAVSGAALGAVAGAIIGNHSGSLGHDGLRGAAWGAGIGLLAGQIAGDARAEREWRGTQVPAARGRRDDFRRGPVHGVDRDALDWQRPLSRGDGLVLGAITGAVIGNHSRIFGHRGDRGAAWGAGLGLILGAIAQDSARGRALPPPRYVVEAPAPVAPAQPPQITIINNYYGPVSPMAPANQLFGRN